ncbi:hypothetical protein PLICRDRAFT_337791 [Plicaturopsis crispa FD-325 SS-3]|uniref:Uncharacterized protein n=1 Tax=Plicaturopsis crispa FD-325 SS-3 TaxID=944288 RepID=A0A0C9SLC8_PLICR|nr:hypothetical protein PLICRDRAFT_337791 [Plicaturopsis crispa FD-325 SS-3]
MQCRYSSRPNIHSRTLRAASRPPENSLSNAGFLPAAAYFSSTANAIIPDRHEHLRYKAEPPYPKRVPPAGYHTSVVTKRD